METMVVKIDIFMPHITSRRIAIDKNLEIGSIPITPNVTLELVFNRQTGEIIQGMFQGVETDLFEEIDGEFKSGRNEYPLLLSSLESGQLTRLVSTTPSQLLLSDGKTIARFW